MLYELFSDVDRCIVQSSSALRKSMLGQRRAGGLSSYWNKPGFFLTFFCPVSIFFLRWWHHLYLYGIRLITAKATRGRNANFARWYMHGSKLAHETWPKRSHVSWTSWAFHFPCAYFVVLLRPASAAVPFKTRQDIAVLWFLTCRGGFTHSSLFD